MIELETVTIKEAAEMSEGNEKLLKEMIDKLRQWLQQQLHLPQEIPVKQIQRILLTSKFNLEKAKKRIDLQYTIHNLMPEVFANYDPQSNSFEKLHKSMQLVYLPKLSPEKYRIFIGRLISKDLSMFDPYDMIRYSCMLIDVRTKIDTITSNILIWDCVHATFGHIMKMTPNTLKNMNLCMEAQGTRFKALYFINAPPFIDKLLSMIQLFMTPKIFGRIKIFTSGAESLHEVLPKSILPSDYDGKELSMKTLTDMWRATLIEQKNWILQQAKLKSNESLRTESVIDPDDLFGVSGTFKQLEID